MNLMQEIFNILKKEDGFEKAEFINIPKYKLSFYVS